MQLFIIFSSKMPKCKANEKVLPTAVARRLAREVNCYSASNPNNSQLEKRNADAVISLIRLIRG